jgi:four helix bundle protein
MRNFKELQVWQKAHELSIAAYRITSSMPRQEVYGLTSQIRRACVSLPANIAEGCGRNGEAELARFMSIAMGSVSELEYYWLLCSDLKMLKPDDCDALAEKTVEVKNMLTAFMVKLKEGN